MQASTTTKGAFSIPVRLPFTPFFPFIRSPRPPVAIKPPHRPNESGENGKRNCRSDFWIPFNRILFSTHRLFSCKLFFRQMGVGLCAPAHDCGRFNESQQVWRGSPSKP